MSIPEEEMESSNYERVWKDGQIQGLEESEEEFDSGRETMC